MYDEFKELKKYIERFDKVLENLSKGDETEDDNEFMNCYHLHLAIAIISSIGDDNAKKVAKMILAQVEWFLKGSFYLKAKYTRSE